MIRITLAAFLVSLTSLALAQEPFSFSQDGRLPSGRTYRLEIRETTYVPRSGEKEDDGGRWGIDGGFPRTNITLFQLFVDNKAVEIPRKLYEDLSHLNRVRVGEVKKLVRVEIRGGDAAGGFNVVYLFKVPREIERVVRSGEMRDHVWERTIWHNDFYDESYDPEK
jgi:hypothetical protein